jgi:hypothetical protein
MLRVPLPLVLLAIVAMCNVYHWGRLLACRKWLVREVMEVVFGRFPSQK